MSPPADRDDAPPPPDDAADLLGAAAGLFRPAALARRLGGRGQAGPPVRLPLVRPGRTDLLLALLTTAALFAGWLAADPARQTALARLARAVLGGELG